MPVENIKFMSIVGARPNFMKIASIVDNINCYNRTARAPRIEHILVHTGQHYDEKLSECFFDDLNLPRPDVNLGVGSGSHAQQTSEIIRRFEPTLLEQVPDVLIVVGDVNSTVSCALVASKVMYRQRSSIGLDQPLIVHVEAGLRSGDRSMPEEINRLLTDALSDVLFVTEEAAIRNLLREGIDGNKISFVGNVMIDTLHSHLEKARGSQIKHSLGINGHSYGLVTLHRPSNVDSRDALEPLVDCLCKLSKRLLLLFPVHPRTRDNLQKFGLLEKLDHYRSLKLSDPLGYLDFLNLMEAAKIVLTDSGGIQEETTTLGVPCITLRENTERPVTVEMGTNYLVGTSPDSILCVAQDILSGRGKKARVPPLWDGHTGERIVNVIVKKCVEMANGETANSVAGS